MVRKIHFFGIFKARFCKKLVKSYMLETKMVGFVI